MNEEEIIKIVLDEAFHIHKTIGPGMLENVYPIVLDKEDYMSSQKNQFL